MEKPKENFENSLLQSNLDNVKKFFNKKQENKMDLTNTPWVTLAVGTELQRLLKDRTIMAGMKVLEVGCSIGVESCFLAKHGMNVTGVDFIPKTIEAAKKYTKFVGADVNFVCCDFLKFEEKGMNGTFDFIFDQGCFHHIPIADRKKYVEKVASLLKREGIFFLRSFSNRMIPSPTNDGPIRLSSDDIYNNFYPYFITEHLYLFNNLPLPNPTSYKPQIFWSYLARKR
jgi:2-polyprenyl-3-methyl-5-hydroxy-6-metoxy-1,4-benzoquinol methylase